MGIQKRKQNEVEPLFRVFNKAARIIDNYPYPVRGIGLLKMELLPESDLLADQSRRATEAEVFEEPPLRRFPFLLRARESG